MKRTISIKLKPTAEQTSILAAVQQEFAFACNLLVSFAQSARTFNAVSLDHLAYYEVRGKSALGSQMVYQAIKSVAGNYGNRAHSDLNASRNIARLGETAISSRVVVDRPNVAAQSDHKLKASDFRQELFT